MNEMKAFAAWFLEQLPGFLLEPPISLIMGLILLILVIDAIKRIKNI